MLHMIGALCVLGLIWRVYLGGRHYNVLLQGHTVALTEHYK